MCARFLLFDVHCNFHFDSHCHYIYSSEIPSVEAFSPLHYILFIIMFIGNTKMTINL